MIGDLGPTAAMQTGAAAEQAAILVDSGVDALIFETYLAQPAAAVLREVREAVRGSVPILVSLREWPARASIRADRPPFPGPGRIGAGHQLSGRISSPRSRSPNE